MVWIAEQVGNDVAVTPDLIGGLPSASGCPVGAGHDRKGMMGMAINMIPLGKNTEKVYLYSRVTKPSFGQHVKTIPS